LPNWVECVYLIRTKYFMVTIIKNGSSKAQIKQLVGKVQAKKKGLDAKKFSGIIKLKDHPLNIQKSMRDEWE
jgi:hypothetical protein